MKIKLIACEVLTRELSLAAAQSEHVIDSIFLPFGLHTTPDELRTRLQQEIDASEGHGYDRIALGYGLCSRGTADLIARTVPVAIPRAHDCITLFLGSRTRYDSEFTGHPGTYYYSPGWVERNEGDVDQGSVSDRHGRLAQERFAEYVERYGEDNARFLIEQESLWLANYTRAALIDMGIGAVESYREFVRGIASSRGWDYEEIEGEMSLLRRLTSAESDGDFLVLKPAERVIETFDERIISSE